MPDHSGEKSPQKASSRGLEALSKGIHLIWHGVNDPQNLEIFGKSNIYWAEGDLRTLPDGPLILRHDPFDLRALEKEEVLLEFGVWCSSLLKGGRGIQIDLKEGGETMDRMIRYLKDAKIPEDRLWFTTNLKDVPMDDYARLGKVFPGSRLQNAIPLRFMFGEMSPEEREAWLSINRELGVGFLSIPWTDEPTGSELKTLKEAGFGLNLFYVDTVGDFQKAAALKPDSVTSDFHIPEWGLYGRGSGENGFYHSKKA